MTEQEKTSNEEQKLWERFRKISQHKKSTCLDDNTMAAYLDNKLWGKRRCVAEEHLAACSFCLDKVMEIHSLLTAEIAEAPEKVKLRAQNIIPESPKKSYEYSIKTTVPLFRIFVKPKECFELALVSLLVFISCYAGMKFGKATSLFTENYGTTIFSWQSFNEDNSNIDLFGNNNSGTI